jgi:hypothetical protein
VSPPINHAAHFLAVFSDGGLIGIKPERRSEEEAGEGRRHNFLIRLLAKIRISPYVVAVVRTEGAPDEARLRDKAKRARRNSYTRYDKLAKIFARRRPARLRRDPPQLKSP